MVNIKQLSKRLIALTILTSSSLTFALDNDLQSPLNIAADSAHFDQKTGTAIYEGNVTVKQGSIFIEADYLKVTSSTETNQFRQLNAKGSPAKFSQKIDLEGNEIISHGDKILYQTVDATLELSGQSYVKLKGDEIRADFIQYMIDKGTFTARKDNTGRVNMTLLPQTQEVP
ncbi:lipopolysaccharide transport periplasmic protein LptA [Marinomonas sp. 15G1-11]|uniref:Lipopolysaccharide export system protein LptA n=1 Tax=Marinomonas phaeophyticola TaxID=3004091 RepID=A0ABT4JXD5_9GAMM|nr:lipopolysaccharide transport periplasmic protein LptA [Marinomonas sp. 15G1-11]MCZ2723035.1 lipopolysaccharide transport periplasmic protein LptA [Marinomonas sp. 15G1-11]